MHRHHVLSALVLSLLILGGVPAMPSAADAAEPVPQAGRPAKDSPAPAHARVTAVSVELDGTDSIGAQLGMRVKERFNGSSLFRLDESRKRTLRLLISTRPEFAERPHVGSVYAICWTFSEGDGYLDFLLARELGTVSAPEIDALVARILERSDGIAVKYGSLWKQ